MSDFAEASGTPLLSLPPRTDTFFINLVFKSMVMMLTWTNALYEDCKQARKKTYFKKIHLPLMRMLSAGVTQVAFQHRAPQ